MAANTAPRVLPDHIGVTSKQPSARLVREQRLVRIPVWMIQVLFKRFLIRDYALYFNDRSSWKVAWGWAAFASAAQSMYSSRRPRAPNLYSKAFSSARAPTPQPQGYMRASASPTRRKSRATCTRDAGNGRGECGVDISPQYTPPVGPTTLAILPCVLLLLLLPVLGFGFGLRA